jgi:hypothetical protein
LWHAKPLSITVIFVKSAIPSLTNSSSNIILNSPCSSNVLIQCLNTLESPWCSTVEAANSVRPLSFGSTRC